MPDVLPWLEYNWSFDFPVGMYRAILERVRGTPARAEEMLRGVSREILTRKPGGKWSVLEHAGHLWTLEALHHGRIEQYLRNEKALVAADMSNRATSEAGYNAMPAETVLRGFREARAKMLQVLDPLNLAEAARSAVHPRLKRELRLVDTCYFIAEHDDHHLAVIRTLL